jgi:hypothetical protein
MHTINIRTTLTAYILLMAVTSFVMVPYLPAYTKTAGCCSCCVQSPCHCGCTSPAKPAQQGYSSFVKNTLTQCSIDTCTANVPINVPETVIVNVYAPSSKKKAFLNCETAIVRENKFLVVCYSPQLEPYQKLPDDSSLFMHNSCLLL